MNDPVMTGYIREACAECGTPLGVPADMADASASARIVCTARRGGTIPGCYDPARHVAWREGYGWAVVSDRSDVHPGLVLGVHHPAAPLRDDPEPPAEP